MGIVLPPAATDNDFRSAVGRGLTHFGSTQTMSSSNHHANGTITLKRFSELASVLDLESLQPGPSEPDDTGVAVEVSASDANPHGYIDEPDSFEPQSINLAS